MRKIRTPHVGALALLSVLSAPHAQTLGAVGQEDDLPRTPQRNILFEELDDGSIVVADEFGTQWFANFEAYVGSGFFEEHGMRCGSEFVPTPLAEGTTGDCSSSNTNPASEYEPTGGPDYVIPVVFHVLINTSGAGNIPDAQLNNQIDILNEDFGAMAGNSNGTPQIGVNSRIQFTLAGITRTVNRQWYNDRQSYWESLAWDTTRYLNIYTNTAGGNLGYAYVPSGGGVVGNTWDRVVLYWPSVGRNSPYGPPYDQGRTGTHEVGHYLGLYHTFQGGCATASAPGCYTSGDLICDTNSEGSAFFGCGNRTTCGSPDPTDNYMDYTDDLCMNRFTSEQANRMRCTLANFRVDLVGPGGGNPPGPASSPSPSNGASGVSTSANLSWSAGSGATSHDVYFGTDSTPDAGEFQGNQAGTSFDPGTLSEGTTYYWRIDEVNADGTTTGDVWSFTTETTGGSGITLSANGYKVRGVHHADLSWSGASGPVDITRNGQTIATGVAGSSYTDNTGQKGGGSYAYQVCESGGGSCSNVANVVF